MAEFGKQETIQLDAAADLSAHQYNIMRLSAADTCNVASLDTSSTIVGVLQNVPNNAAGARCTVAYAGKSKVRAGAAISANAIITTNGSGRAVACGSGDMAIGRALQAAGADGDIITCLLFAPTRWAGAV